MTVPAARPGAHGRTAHPARQRSPVPATRSFPAQSPHPGQHRASARKGRMTRPSPCRRVSAMAAAGPGRTRRRGTWMPPRAGAAGTWVTWLTVGIRPGRSGSIERAHRSSTSTRQPARRPGPARWRPGDDPTCPSRPCSRLAGA